MATDAPMQHFDDRHLAVDEGAVAGRVHAAAGARVGRWRPAPAGGYSVAFRRLADLEDGRTVFVKAATTPHIAQSIRRERVVYAHFAGSGDPFLPAMLGFDDDGRQPVLILEDLSGQRWPPPWRTGDIDRMMDTLERVWSAPHPPDTPRATDVLPVAGCWERLAADPAPALSLGLFDAPWLDAHLPSLIEAERSAALDGPDFLHSDVRSDNTCLRDGRPLLVDWNWSCSGGRRLDLAFWLPSLRLEGGPLPDEIAPGFGPEAALIAGYFAFSAPQPAPAGAPRVRAFQYEQLEVALPWACRALDLPAPIRS